MPSTEQCVLEASCKAITLYRDNNVNPAEYNRLLPRITIFPYLHDF